MNILLIASSRNLKDEFVEAAKDLGHAIGLNNDTLIYGGGTFGLMGVVAQSALDNGAKVKGITPTVYHDMTKHEGHASLSTHVVEDLFERKKLMVVGSDLAVALPGGTGSLDEILEVGAANDIQCYANPDDVVKPIVILNINGYYESLRRMFHDCIDAGAMSPNRLKMYEFVQNVPEALEAIERHRQNPVRLHSLV